MSEEYVKVAQSKVITTCKFCVAKGGIFRAFDKVYFVSQ